MKVNSTPHIECTDTDKIAKVVLMPGDPKRAEFLAKTYLTDVIKFNNIRGMWGFTGNYKGHKISVMGSGMGMPSIGIYSFELYKFYGVEKIIRIGSSGAYDPNLDLFDVVLVTEAYSESSFGKSFSGDDSKIIAASPKLNEELLDAANRLGKTISTGRIHSSDVFYKMHGTDAHYYLTQLKCRAVEMESFSLFHVAKALGKQAACLLTISDSFCFSRITTPMEREQAFNNMMEIALEITE